MPKDLQLKILGEFAAPTRASGYYGRLEHG